MHAILDLLGSNTALLKCASAKGMRDLALTHNQLTRKPVFSMKHPVCFLGLSSVKKGRNIVMLYHLMQYVCGICSMLYASKIARKHRYVKVYCWERNVLTYV
ncbi:hypothetical protein ANANG_G00144160 [Anguilla anguilla]|uniref:Uncharacterized protein n=1 Tax=Anguilla anguilla TaxID=7936 RepID=A0A9D3S0H7_ANGAN|nr:hypothetical protein ANANG_G00144160 [Anguilla anguilla]